MMTAGKVFGISPSKDGAKSTRQTSPRCIASVADQSLAEGKRRLALAFGCHCRVGLGEVREDDMGSRETFEELPIFSWPTVRTSPS
jgi:hypothetical protein